ncbi:MAG: hypothetical protein IKS17_09025 [Firmicutes bacterium]|nr:hypothetical protein [Bacillota bacterium]
MRKTAVMLAALMMLAGCGTNGGEHEFAPRNDVEAVMRQNMEKKTESAAEPTTAEETTVGAVVQTETQACEQTSAAPVNETAETAETAAPVPETPAPGGDAVDLTGMDSDMVYAVVFEMVSDPDRYRGREVKMHGTCNRFTDPETGKDYYACIITDAQACCAQGIEFELPEGEPYPEYGSEITVSGIFDSYFEGENEFYVLKQAVIK